MNTNKINISTELMKNYKQTALMSPEAKFEVLQTNTGCSLLFSIGTDNVFYVTEETVGHSSGWSKTDLSTAQITKSFPGQTGLFCKTFEAAQSVVDGTIGVAMVISDGTSDHLFLSLGNSNSDTIWINTPNWVQYPFDNPPKDITIVNVFMSETVNNTQYVVVDTIKDPTSAEKLISRYYIDTQPNAVPVWQSHGLSIDLEADGYTTCLGRQHLLNTRHQPTIDGLYTCGQIQGQAQFSFQPLYNEFNPNTPATPALLQLPGGLVPDTIASCRQSDMSTDLYVCSQGGLYYFASSNQNTGATAVSIMQNPIFNGVKKMYAYQTDETVTVWGLNGNDEIFYTSCPVGQELASPSVWSYPLPIATGVDMFSPYINRADGGNTFFAVADDTLQKLIKSTETSMWQTQSVTLPSVNTADTQKYSSYTTRIHVTDENNQPVMNTPVSISSETRTGVYINHLYYVIDSTGIQINTDETGSITIVEWVNGLTGTKLNVSDGSGNVTKVNPMETPFGKIAQLNTADSLKNAVITNSDGSTQPLVSGSVSQNDLESAAAANQNLSQVYNKLSGASAPTLTAALTYPPTAFSIEGVDALWVDLGNLFRWLKSGVEAVIQIIKDAAEDVWHFVAKIAGKVYAGVLDAVEKVVGAMEWVFNAIKTAIKDVIKYAEFLFGWQDILTTHKVMKNVAIQIVQNSINSLSDYKTNIDSVFASIQTDVNKWADIPNFDQTPNSTTASNKPPAGQNSSPAHLGLHHYQGNAANATSSFSPTPVNEGIFQELSDLLDSEENTLNGVADAVKTDVIDNFHSLTLTNIIEALKKIVAIGIDGLLQTAENVLNAAIDVFIKIADKIMEALTAPIEIPVISWLYKEISGEELSILDLICLVGAIPATIIYKIAADTAPFPKGDPFTEGLLNATSFEEIQNLFFTTPSEASKMMAAAGETPALDGIRLKKFVFISDVYALVGSVLLIVTSTIERGLKAGVDNPLPRILALDAAVSNVFYVLPNFGTLINAKTNHSWNEILNDTLTGISVVKGFVNIGLTNLDQQKWTSKLSPLTETVINGVWNAPVIANIVYNKNVATTTYKSLIPESIGNFAFNIGGFLEIFIAKSKDPDTKFNLSIAQFVFMGIYGLCMPIAGGIYAFEKNPVQTQG